MIINISGNYQRCGLFVECSRAVMAGPNGRVRRFPPGFFFWAGSGEHELGHALDWRVREVRLPVSGLVAVRMLVAPELPLRPQRQTGISENANRLHRADSGWLSPSSHRVFRVCCRFSATFSARPAVRLRFARFPASHVLFCPSFIRVLRPALPDIPPIFATPVRLLYQAISRHVRA